MMCSGLRRTKVYSISVKFAPYIRGDVIEPGEFCGEIEIDNSLEKFDRYRINMHVLSLISKQE